MSDSNAGTTSVKEMTPEQTAEAIKNVEEDQGRVHYDARSSQGNQAERDSAREINEVANDLKQCGVIRETISAAEETGLRLATLPRQ